MNTWQVAVKRSLWFGVGAAAIVTAGCAGTVGQKPTMLTGAQEVPPVTTGASGSTDISVNWFKCPSAASSDNCPTVVGMVTTSGMTGTSAEIREGAPGQKGPVIVNLVRTNGKTWAVPSGTTLTDVQYAEYWAGQLYVNVDSQAHKDGEIRVQLMP